MDAQIPLPRAERPRQVRSGVLHTRVHVLDGLRGRGAECPAGPCPHGLVDFAEALRLGSDGRGEGADVDPRLQAVPVASPEALLGEPFLVTWVLRGHGWD